MVFDSIFTELGLIFFGNTTFKEGKKLWSPKNAKLFSILRLSFLAESLLIK